MSYAPPVGGFPTPQPAPGRARAAALPGLAALLIVELLLELAILAFDLNRQGAAYLPTALGINYDHFVDGVPVSFTASDTATVLLLIVLIIAAFTGRGWVRAAGIGLLLPNAYIVVMTEVSELTGADPIRHAWGSPLLPNLLLSLDAIAQVVFAVIFAVVVAVTVQRPVPSGYPAPFPPQAAPSYGAPIPPQPVAGYPAPMAAPAQQPIQPPAYGYPPRPPQAPPTA
ncbi:hypothetical protein [Kitasatospora kifunensis]|uniref:Uncharacterized protein n=1 Tax=Kitasatospora kifunensis TaxID=58351 RepID=A0A7W7R000_KITKI|nr:hypothetical protein [Kitasatospora kifunensis]MBB4922824.1 hypothetical protein [Kitasatospora kifunensis]